MLSNAQSGDLPNLRCHQEAELAGKPILGLCPIQYYHTLTCALSQSHLPAETRQM